MISYMLRRVLQAIPTILGVTILSFMLMYYAPGDPIQIMTFGTNTNAEDRARLAEEFCLDRSAAEQYMIWMIGDVRKGKCATKGILRGDFGVSLRDRQPVLGLITQRIGPTVELGVWALIMGVFIGVTVGVISAIRHGSWVDNMSRFFSVVFDALPSFWLALIMIMYFSVQLGWLPVGGRLPLNDDDITILDRARHLVMPSFVLAVGWIALMSRFMRAETLEVIRREYVRTAHSKGLHPRQVNFKHAARNALIPVVTFLGPGLVGLLSGAVVIERIFSWPGLGRLIVDAVNARNYPIVMASVIFSAVLVVTGNLLTDFLLVLVDPRIRLS